jgi:hypothetical protein
VAAVATTSVTALVSDTGAAGAATKTLIASDSLQRTVAAGFGKADIGGAYTVSAVAHTDVRPGSGDFTGITPGHSVVARLDSARGADVTALLTFAVPARPSAGNGLYIYEELRRQPNGDAYTVKVRIQQNGQLSLAFSRYHGAVETAIGAERKVLLAKPGQLITVEGRISGSTTVSLAAALWSGSTASVPDVAWQDQYTDGSSARIASSGSLALMAYQSQGGGLATALSLRRYQAWASTSGTPSSSPTSPPPSSSQPSAPSAPRSSSTPTKSSSPSPTSGPGSSSSSKPSSPTSSPAPPPSDGGSGPGSAGPGQTAYPIPTGAIFVSPQGNDSAPATLSAPLRTLARAITVAQSGATIVMRAGAYNESVTVPTNKTLTIQSYPHEAVWLDGSVPVSSWTQRGSTWVHSGWTAQFDSTPSYTSTVPTGQDFTFVNPAYPMAAHPDQVWVDGSALTQVSPASAIGAGDFYVDSGNGQLVVGSNPTGRDVRASNLSVAYTSYSLNSVLRGIGVRNYADSIGQIGAVRLDGAHATVENLVVDNNATTGLDAQATGASIRNVTLEGNGMLGMVAHFADGLSISGMLSEGNNTEHFNYAPVSGGLKITGTRGVTVTDSAFLGNLGTGVWFDESCYDVTLTGSEIRDNVANGVSDEISSTGLIADNTIDGNGAIGLKINNTDHIRAWNNTITGNNSEVQIVEDARRGNNPSDGGHDSRQKQPDPTEPWIASDDTLMNNVLGPVPSGSTVVIVRDYSGQYSAAELEARLGGNAFVGPVGGPEVVWGTGGSNAASYGSVAAFQSGTSQSGNTAPSGAAQIDVTSGQSLPADIATAIGQPAGSRHVGAF